jgi:hypothetical protein
MADTIEQYQEALRLAREYIAELHQRREAIEKQWLATCERLQSENEQLRANNEWLKGRATTEVVRASREKVH